MNVVVVTSPAGMVAKYFDEYVCLWLCVCVWLCLCVCLSVCVYVCLSVCLFDCEDISGTTRTIFGKFFVHVACVRGSVLLRHVYDRPHRLLSGRGFLPH